MGKDIGRTIVICPNCGEDNAASFRFCGMCGTPLEARRPAGAPRVASTLDAPHVPQHPATATEQSRTPVAPTATQRTESSVPSIGGPSLLGLNHSQEDQDRNGPSLDTLRDKSFSGLDSFFEPEEPKTGARRIILLLVLLVALGAAGWWAYSNYNDIGSKVGRNSQTRTATPAPSDTTADNPATKTETSPATHPAPDAGTAPTASTAPPPASTDTASVPPAAPPKVEQRAAAPPKPAAKMPTPKKTTRPAPAPAHTAAPAPTDTGDAAFKKGEAYLYGRGVPKNCDEAVKNLKAASAKQNAKARSTFGTMYATGHCVPRDLPTSYSWFALALRVDPNNQILEKDLVGVWNQMTPPERQMATRAKQ